VSFAGRGVLVTRPAGMAGELARRIERAGGRALLFPMIEIEALARPGALERLGDFALAVFVSPTAVAQALAAVGDVPARWPADLAVAAVGEGTRRALEQAGFSEVLAPRDGADSEALLAVPQLSRFFGKRILLVRGAGGRELLANELAARGCQVELAECYRRVKPAADSRALLETWDAGHVSAVTVFSREALDNLAARVGGQRLAARPLFVSHERIAAHAQRRGLQPIVAGPGDDVMLERLVAYFDERD
jgi:uroporphyrinogen-III synthase